MDRRKKINLSLGQFFIIFALALVLPIGLMNCSKKDEPTGEYGEGGEGSEGGRGSGANEGDLKSGGGKSGALRTVYFDYDSASLSGDAKSALDGNASYLKSKSNTNFTIEGHCDERGSTEYNLALGERRANAVRSYLSNLGVKKDRLRTVSYGEERPAMSGSNESAWAKNRRAEFTAR